jgi:hypothetical protein
MEEIIKTIGDVGLGAGAIACLIVVVLKQMDLIKAMNANIAANTEVTKSLTEKIQQSIEVDRRVVESIEYCKTHNQPK